MTHFLNHTLLSRNSRLYQPIDMAIATRLKACTVAYWKLDEASGTRADSTGNTTALAEINGVGSSSGAKIGLAALFDRADTDFLAQVNQPALNLTGNISIAGWINTLSYSPVGCSNGVISYWDTAGNNRAYTVNFPATTDRLSFSVSSDGTGGGVSAVNSSSFGVLPLNEWLFFVAWHDATAQTINIQINNGAVNSSAHVGGIFSSSANLLVGGFTNDTWNGRIDELAVFDCVFTQEERTYLYNNNLGVTYDYTDPTDFGIGEFSTAFDFSFTTGDNT